MSRNVKRPVFELILSAIAVLVLFSGTLQASDAYGEIIKTKTFTTGEVVELDVNTSMSEAELNLQWYKDGVMLPFTGKHFRKPNATIADAGIYTVTYDFCHSSYKKSIVVIVNKDNPNLDLAGEDIKQPLKGLDDMQSASFGFTLLPNEPNPFSDVTKIKFLAETDGNVQIAVVDMLGNRVAMLFDAHVSAGQHQVEFFPGKYNISSGLYYYTLTAPGYSDSKPMMIVK